MGAGKRLTTTCDESKETRSRCPDANSEAIAGIVRRSAPTAEGRLRVPPPFALHVIGKEGEK